MRQKTQPVTVAVAGSFHEQFISIKAGIDNDYTVFYRM